MSGQAVHVFITGRVQGVFFRQSMKAKAIQNSVNGWVRNLKDGRVEAVMEGTSKDIATMVEWCHGGPANSIVEDVEIKNENYTGSFDTFTVRY